MIQFDRNKVTFQPCPRCFPDLWREECLAHYLDLATEEDIEAVRRLFQSPGMHIWFKRHGFLVHDNVLMGPWGGYESMVDLTAIVEQFDLPRECLERAREFGLINERSRCCVSYGQHLGHCIKMKECTAVAREIWAPPAYHGEIIAVPGPKFEPWFQGYIQEQERTQE